MEMDAARGQTTGGGRMAYPMEITLAVGMLGRGNRFPHRETDKVITVTTSIALRFDVMTVMTLR